jgi:hypothetical protein
VTNVWINESPLTAVRVFIYGQNLSRGTRMEGMGSEELELEDWAASNGESVHSLEGVLCAETTSTCCFRSDDRRGNNY